VPSDFTPYRSIAAQDLVVIVLTQRLFETPAPPKVHREIQAAAYRALA
jgi:hypothetical protein